MAKVLSEHLDKKKTSQEDICKIATKETEANIHFNQEKGDVDVGLNLSSFLLRGSLRHVTYESYSWLHKSGILQ